MSSLETALAVILLSQTPYFLFPEKRKKNEKRTLFCAIFSDTIAVRPYPY
jgi:hypothetical protein